MVSMMTNIKLIGLCLFGGIVHTALASGEIYVSYDANGAPRFANQAYDASYTLYSKNAEPATSRLSASRGSPAARDALLPAVQKAARHHDLDPALITAVIDVESGFNANARSSKGAVGPMQVLPATAARYGSTNFSDPAQNVALGTRHLKGLVVKFDGNLALALAAYNAGEGAVTRHGQSIPPFRETMLYVPAVLTQYRTYQRQASAVSQ